MSKTKIAAIWRTDFNSTHLMNCHQLWLGRSYIGVVYQTGFVGIHIFGGSNYLCDDQACGVSMLKEKTEEWVMNMSADLEIVWPTDPVR